MMLETGRVCMKTAGREAGRYCVVVEPVDESFVITTGPRTVTKVKRRKCNVLHLEPTQHTFNISQGASDEAVEKAWKSSGLIESLKIEVPEKPQKKE